MDIDIASKLFPNITTLIVQLLATAVMLCIFKKFLWKPMQNYFAKRADYIEGTVNDAKNMQQKAKALMEASEEQSRAAAKEYRNIVEKAKIDAGKTRDSIIEKANEEAKEKLDRVSKEIEAEKRWVLCPLCGAKTRLQLLPETEKLAAKAEVKSEIVNIAIDVASKIMNQEMNQKTNEKLVDEFIKEIDK